MGDRSHPPDLKLVLLLVLGAIGLALLAVGVVTAAGWALIVPGCVALLVSLSGAWLIQKSRDRTLR
jgi:CHASE2 domain-containing sensor protein